MYNSQSAESSKKLILDQASKRLVDSAIMQRLTAELPTIKTNMQQILKTGDPFKQKRDKLKEAIIKRRRISVSVGDKEKVRKSLSFIPFADESYDVPEFDLRKKIFESPLVDAQQGEELNKARISHQNLYVKMGEFAKPKYELDPYKISFKAYEGLQPSLNLAEKHYVMSVLEQESLTRRSLSQQLTATHSFVKQRPEDKDIIEVYEPRKFNKMDMKAIEIWFEECFQILTNSKPKLSDKDYLHQLFGLYISSLKQYIRLTYVDSIDKAVLLEKLIFSFISVFDNMMYLQHKILYNQFKEYKAEFNQLKDIFQKKEADLNEKIQKLSQEYRELTKKYNRLVVVYASNRRVNKELVFEVEQYSRLARELREALQHLKSDHFRLLKQLQQTGRIQQLNNKYYIVNHYNSPEIITNFILGPDQYEKFLQKINRVSAVESELTKYWIQVENDFAIAKMAPKQQLLPIKLQACVQTQNTENYCDQGVQNYSLKSHLSEISVNSQDRFESFLNKELDQEYRKREEEQKALVISLQQLYDQAYNQNLMLKANNQRLEEEIARQLDNSAKLQKQINYMHQKNTNQQANNIQLRLEIDKLCKQSVQKDYNIQQLREKIKKLQTDIKSERFNNEIFIKNEMELRRKIERIQRDNTAIIKSLKEQVNIMKIKITKGVPVFNDYLDLVQSSPDKRYQAIANRIEQIFKEDLKREEKDANPFLTK